MKIKPLNIKFDIKNIPEITLEAIYLLNIFLVPVWFSYFFPGFNMFELSKTILFRFFFWFLFILLFIWLIQNGRIKRLFKSLKEESFKYLWQLWWPPLLLIIGLFLILPFSVDIKQSFFGSYTRIDGLTSYLSYFFWALLLFIYLISVKTLQGRKVFDLKIKRIIVTSVLSAFLVSVYGILQIMNIDFLAWTESPYLTGRTISSLGQPNFLASFLLIVIPLSAYLLYKSKTKRSKVLYFLILLTQLIALFFTSSRGGLVALLALIGLSSIVLFLYGKIKRKIKLVIILSFLFFIILSFGTIELFNPGRIKNSFDLSSGSLAARVFFFQSASHAILQEPIVGYGLENSEEVFIKYYERDWALHGRVSANPDRAHNIVLDTLLNTGFIGLILFSLWFYSIFRLGFIEFRTGEKPYLSLAITLGVFAYLVSLLFSFQIVTGDVYLWTLFALLAAISVKRTDAEDKYVISAYSDKQKIFIWSLLLIVATISLVGLRTNYRLLRADNYLHAMNSSLSNMEFIRAQLLHKKIVEINPNPKHLEKASSYLAYNLSNYCVYNQWRDLSEERLITNRMEELLELIPENKFEYLFIKARIHSCLNNPEEAEKYFTEVATITPAWPKNYLEWGMHYVNQGDLKKAENFFQLADINLPDVNSEVINQEHKQEVKNYKYIMYSQLGEAYQKEGNQKRATLFLEAAYRNSPKNYSLLKKVADSYYLQGDLDSAIRYNLYGLQSNPEDYNWHLALAVLYFESSDLEKSLVYLDKAIDLAPEEKKEGLRDMKTDYLSTK